MMHASTAVFTVKDVLESMAYYRDKLGFDVAFEYGKPTFYVGLVKRAAKVLKEPKDYDYGLRDFDVADLDGNMIFFGMESKKPS
jgi:catechol-2,3-dioxygenase